MIGLDTNIVLRYLLQDDPERSYEANRLISDKLSAVYPGVINLATVLEIVWVLQGRMKRSPKEITAYIEDLVAADSFMVQNEEQVMQAADAFRSGFDFEDALIGALNLWAGCSTTFTFDRKAARLPYFQRLT